MEDSAIGWTDHSWNPWLGCTKVSPACAHCYALTISKQQGRNIWGKGVARYRTKQASWDNPLKWDKKQRGKSNRPRVFSLSMGDIFDEEVDPQWRADAFEVIAKCQRLDWLLLTKRIELANSMLPDDFKKVKWRHVWIGTTVETQEYADERIPELQKVPAKVRFLSVEPLLGPITFKSLEGIHWVIVGGESGSGFREMKSEWVDSIRKQCKKAGVSFFFKQWAGLKPGANGKELKGKVYDEIPESPAGIADGKRRKSVLKRVKKSRRKSEQVYINSKLASKLESEANKKGISKKELLEEILKKSLH